MARPEPFVSAIRKDQGAAHCKPHEHPSTPFPSSRVAYYTPTLLMLAAIVSLSDLVPNELRGRMAATYLLTVSIVGAGLGPTVVAMTTDYVFGADGGGAICHGRCRSHLPARCGGYHLVWARDVFQSVAALPTNDCPFITSVMV